MLKTMMTTGEVPYDLFVCMILICLSGIFPIVLISVLGYLYFKGETILH